MANQRSNLPEESVPWAREVVEKGIDEAVARAAAAEIRLETANSLIQAQAQQLTTQLNYIRTICELTGTSFPPVSTAQEVAPDPEPVPEKPTVVLRTRSFAATWSCSWYQSFKQTDSDARFLIQRGSGYSMGMWGFDVGEARGKKIVKAELFLSNSSTYYNGAFTAILGTHNFSSEPGSRPFTNRQNGWDVGWSAGQGKYIPLPAWMRTSLSNGSIRGFTVGDGGRDTKNYARFNGVGRTGAPVLRLTYEL